MSSNTTEIDATIEAVFGAPPDGTDLTESTVTTYDVVSCVVLGLAAASVALRFYVRTMNGKNNLAIDDWTILIGLVRLAVTTPPLTTHDPADTHRSAQADSWPRRSSVS